MPRRTVDLAIVGGGPAGLAAAVEARRWGMSTVLLDENRSLGGRIWQALEARGAIDPEEEEGLALIRAAAESGAEIHQGAGVWAIEPGGMVFWSENGQAFSLRAQGIVLATGTTERPMPIPGWTLPGVMTVGAAQIALKTAGLVPSGQTWIAGQGPLTLLYAAQAIRAGGKIAGILDMSERPARWRALPHALSAVGAIRKGLGWLKEIRHARVPIYRGSDLRAEGDEALQRISFRSGGAKHTEAADLLLLHDGVIPSIQLTRALGCEHAWDAAQRCWKPVTDAWGRTSVPGISVAGDGASVAGAEAAVPSGRLAALGFVDSARRDRDAASLRNRLAAARASRPFIDRLFAPLAVVPEDSTLICRCEEVSAGQIRAAVKLGCQGLNQLKAFTRCGMGPCQGRMCGPTAAGVFAAASRLHPRGVEPFRTRFPARPLTVGELAALDG